MTKVERSKVEKLRDSICKRLKIEDDPDDAKARQLIIDGWNLIHEVREEGHDKG